MRGNYELGSFADELVDRPQRSELACGRKRRFRFVEQVETVPTQLVRQQRHEGFTM
jgi:hypothetical protein